MKKKQRQIGIWMQRERLANLVSSYSLMVATQFPSLNKMYEYACKRFKRQKSTPKQ